MIQPPSVGPRVGATMMPSRKIACTRPCCSRGKICRRSPGPWRAAPLRPRPAGCARSPARSSELEVPQKNEATMKMTIEIVR